MKNKSFTFLIGIAFMLGMMTFKKANSQTAGTMSFTVTPATQTGSYSAKHFVAVWIEYSSTSAFIKTRNRYGSSGNCNSHLLVWKAKSVSSVVDATTAATLSAYTSLTFTWKGNDITGSAPYNLLPDGVYKVGIDYSWDDASTAESSTYVTFTKGPTAQTLTPTSVTNFSGMTISWTPKAQISLVTSALASTSYCAGSTVSVPFTKGATDTVYNNNIWTAQLSDASGSFVSPVSIGTLSGAATGSINATIPAGTALGSGYRIRVIGSQPAANGTDNGTNISITTAPSAPTIGTITQPSCVSPTGSVVLNGLPATGNWTINPGNVSGTGTTTTLTGLASGTFAYTVSSGCASLPSSNVIINAAPTPPSAPTVGSILQASCNVSTATVVLNGLPSTGNWILNPGTITGTGTTTTLSGLGSGTLNYTVTNAAGCTSAASVNIVLNTQPPTPFVTNQSTSILTTGTFTVNPSGVPIGTTYTWLAPTYTGGVSGGSSQSLPQSNISGILTIPTGTGTAIYTVTPTSGSCIGATFTVTVTVSSTCVAVNISTQAVNNSMCETTGNASFTIGVSGTSPYTYQWEYYNGSSWSSVVNGTPAGAIYTNANTGTLDIIGITLVGSSQYRCYLSNCNGTNNTTSNAVTLSVNAHPTAPTLGNITQPNCTIATGSVVLNGLPATGNWSIHPGTYSGTGTTASIAGLTAATYNFTVTDVASCTSLASANVVINTQPATPPTPIITMNGNTLHSNSTSGNQWYNLSGIIIGATNQDLPIVSNGSYYTIVTVNGCSSIASNTIQTNVGIETIKHLKTFNIYPNPVSNELIIKTEGNERTDFMLLNSMGQLILKGMLIEKTIIETSGFAPGIYFLKLETGKTIEYKKIIKE